MSGHLDNTLAELTPLKGATVFSIKVGEMDLGGYTAEVLSITFKLKTPIPVDDMPACHLLTYEVWQDAEGNGPGFLALADAK